MQFDDGHTSLCGGNVSHNFQQYMSTYRLQLMSCTASNAPPALTSNPTPKSNTGAACNILRRLHPALSAEFRVPALRSSFSVSLHPQYEVVRELCDGWIEEVAQPPSTAARQLLRDCVLPRLICRNIPTASSIARLVHVTKMIAWLTITDDENDHPDVLGADEASTTCHAAHVLSILLHGTTAEADRSSAISSSAPISTQKAMKQNAALASLWADMGQEMSPVLRSRFISTMEDYFDALKVQASYRKAHRLPDIQAYTKLRRHASFILPCIVLLEYALGVELDDATYANDRIQEFRNAAVDYICLCNDLISCRVEIGVGDYFNMPSIAYASWNHRSKGDASSLWTFQAAADRVADMAHDLDARCASMLQSTLPKLPASAEAVRTYLSGLCTCMSGSLAWYRETARYAATWN